MKKLSIAIDGPAGAGKSSVSKILAARLGYAYLDTGAMYRAVTYEAIERKLVDPEAVAAMAEALDMEVLPGQDGMHVITDGRDVTPFIRTPEVSGRVSEVSAIGRVRKAMVALQRKQAEKGGIVLDGRDIGTTVLPKADIKIFLTASVHIRAVRRFKELTEGHPEMTMEDVEKEISRRDYLDSHREISPLKKAEDAVLLDNGELTLEGTAEAIIRICRSKFPGFDA
ncbi:(d)CMP kinase [Dialister sp.]|uniref:(d)CMP kinase n=1 Tax=Dialister sp. TaxID=1955814 RepID=UPI003EFFCE82